MRFNLPVIGIGRGACLFEEVCLIQSTSQKKCIYSGVHLL
jgi:hypothetical protein